MNSRIFTLIACFAAVLHGPKCPQANRSRPQNLSKYGEEFAGYTTVSYRSLKAITIACDKHFKKLDPRTVEGVRTNYVIIYKKVAKNVQVSLVGDSDVFDRHPDARPLERTYWVNPDSGEIVKEITEQ